MVKDTHFLWYKVKDTHFLWYLEGKKVKDTHFLWYRSIVVLREKFLVFLLTPIDVFGIWLVPRDKRLATHDARRPGATVARWVRLPRP